MKYQDSISGGHEVGVENDILFILLKGPKNIRKRAQGLKKKKTNFKREPVAIRDPKQSNYTPLSARRREKEVCEGEQEQVVGHLSSI